MQIEDLEGSIEAMLFSTQFERLNPLLNEDKAVLIRGLVLPEENAPPKISVQEIVPLEVARVSLPSLISIKVPVNGAVGARPADCAAALPNLFRAKPGETEVRLRLEKPRDFSVILDVPSKYGRTRNSAPKSPASAEPKRWKSWPAETRPPLSFLKSLISEMADTQTPPPRTPVGIACFWRATPSVRIRSTTSSACSRISTRSTATVSSPTTTPWSPAWAGSMSAPSW